MSSCGIKVASFTVSGLLLTFAGCASPTVIAVVPAGQPAAAPAAPALKTPSTPTAHEPVIRNSTRAKRTLHAATGAYTKAKPATYPDGVTVTIVRVKHQVEKDQGPGAFTGRANTTLAISVTNHSTRAIDLTRVVVNATYGRTAQPASPVYDDPTVGDFTGTLKPGASATASYAFAIPASQRRQVQTSVDFDATHLPAEFDGATS